MNTYTTTFFADCPNNGVRILYRLEIQTGVVLSVEDIITGVGEVSEGYHEEIADELLQRFGGFQTLTADHHGVTIETSRPHA